MITSLACSLVGQLQPVTVIPGTRAAALYGAREVTEPYYCNYGLNSEYRHRLEAGGLVTSGVGVDGEVRIVELPNHPFFLVTLFVPQARSTAASPHPLMVGFAASAAEHRRGPQS